MDRVLHIAVIALALAVTSSGAWNVRRNADTDSDINKENDLARRTADTDSDTDKEDDQIRMLADAVEPSGESKQPKEELRQNLYLSWEDIKNFWKYKGAMLDGCCGQERKI